MLTRIIPAVLFVTLLSGCGDDLPPWLVDTGNPSDTGRDVPADTIRQDTAQDTQADVVRDVWDAVSDTGTDTGHDVAHDTTPTDQGPTDIADAAVDADATPTDVTADSGDAGDVSDVKDGETRDITLDFGWECEIDDDCTPPVGLGPCEAVRCLNHACIRGWANDLSDCDDGSVCTTDDRCVDGTCTGTTRVCDDGNICTTDYCIPSSGCATSAKNNIPCDDDNPCTISDRCSSKVCHGTSMICEAPPEKACNDTFTAVLTWSAPGQCVDGNCEYQFTSTPCPDGCAGGNCIIDPCSGLVCDSPPGQCLKADGRCVDGDCIYDPDNSLTCSDNDPCTTDRCSGGTCVGTAVVCNDPPDPECTPDGMFLKTWAAQGQCNGGSCDYQEDTIPCSGGCVNGICTSDRCAGVDCSVPPAQCLKAPGRCVDGECEWDPDDSLSCTDYNECTDGDHCVDGDCVPGMDVDCDDSDLCTAEYCDPDSGCVRENIGDECDDGNDCTDNSCSPLFGCDYPWNNAPCSDNNVCSDGDFCDSGKCIPGRAIDCDDDNECTDDRCDSGLGCINTPNTIQCRPAECVGLVLKPAAYCANKACQIPSDLDCDDGESCTIDSCDPETGCGMAFSTATCDDGNACTTNDRCQGGSCAGTRIQCTTPPADYCLDSYSVVRYDTGGTCVGGNCQYQETTHVCEFGCTGGACNGDPCEGLECKNLTNPCKATDGTCSGGVCSYTDVNGIDCDTDASICTTEECQGGTCTFKWNLSCDDGNICTDDDCNPATGCVRAYNSLPCDDGNDCTTPDVCSGGTCGGTPIDCTTPPDDVCDGDAAVHYGIGPCVNGACDWTTTRETCTWGCTAGTCNPDPCLDKVCDHGPDQCHEAVGDCVNGECVYDPLTGTDCDLDDTVCTPDKCDNGFCTAQMPLNCDEGNPCEDYWCDPVEGCKREYNTAPCDDNDKCTENDSCLLGACQPGTDRYCGDTNICTDNGCDPLTGCTITNNSVPCDDANPCTSGDTCGGGTCGGAPYSCDDLPCADRTCDGLGGCEITIADGWCAIDMTCYMSGAENPANECVTCQPGVSDRDWTARAGECDDSDPCTLVDECLGGTCTGSGDKDCDDGEYCTNDWCLAGTGCVHGNRAGSCDDGEPCTVGDSCAGGTCSGSPRDCGETTACQRNWCEPGVGCRSQNLTGPCDDGEPCTIGDECAGGYCSFTGLKNCNDYQTCTTDRCDLDTGNCIHDKLPNLTPCDDGNPCTSDDKCINGYCGGTGLNCFDEDECTDDTCNVDTMTCEYPFNNHLCDDGNACTAGDICSLGSCSGTTITCDDNKVCTDNGCNPTSGCVYTPNSQACDDGDKCTNNDICSGGDCVPGTPVDCDDHNDCTYDHCIPSTGCLHDPISQACNDGDPCTYNDYCFNKTCSGIEITCDPVLPCTTAECDGTDQCAEGILAGWCVISGACVADEQRAPGNPCRYCDADTLQDAWSFDDGTTCDDGEPCTSADTCLSGTCGGSPYSCNDLLDCTADACRGDGSCDNVPSAGWCAIDGACWTDGQNPDGDVCRVCEPALNDKGWTFTGVDCEDGDQCTVDDYCGGGTCHTGVERVCNDHNVCTSDTCEPGRPGGCNFQPVVGICAQPYCDGLVYHTPSACSGTQCPPQETVNCDDGNQCTSDSCTLSGCTNTPRSGSCDDGNSCTQGDACRYGACNGTPYSCTPSGECVMASSCNGDGTCTETPKSTGNECTDDGNPCTADECDGKGSCGHLPKEDGHPCNDNNLCTSGDACLDGTCSDGNDVVCVALDDCHVAGECNPETGLCSNPLADDGTPCDDENPCTSGDICTAGDCSGPDVNECLPVDDCHGQGACNPVTGLCNWPSLPDGTGCDDANPCTTRDVCSRGSCRGLNPIDCSPRDSCHYTGYCDISTGLCNWPEKPDGTTCDDSNACTSGTTCTDGVCANGTTKSCPPLNNCHYEGTCDTGTGICSQPKKADGTPCTDNNACSRDDQCADGSCHGTPFTCSDSRSCTSDVCLGDGTCEFVVNPGTCLIDSYCRTDGQTNPANTCQICDHEESPGAWSPNNGAACNDSRQNTKDDTCNGETCAGTEYDCDDGLACTYDICDGLGGGYHYLMVGWCNIDDTCRADGESNPTNTCQRCVALTSTTSWTPVQDAVTCDDSQPCTYNDNCQSGTCRGTSYSCDDGLECSDNFCLGNGFCDMTVHDGWCLIWDSCVMEGSSNPLNICQQCSTAVSKTYWSPANEGSGCDDGNTATNDDRCVSGNCIGIGESCFDGLECTDDVYTGAECTNPILSGWCLIGGACAWGGNTNPANTCEICDPVASQTSWSANNGVACIDHDACTIYDICVNAECTGTPVNCSDNLECTNDSCVYGICVADIMTGWCVIAGSCVAAGTIDPSNPCAICDPETQNRAWSSNEGAACDDMDPCSSADACVSKTCRGVSYGCDDGIDCTTDTCDGLGGCDHDVVAGWCLIDGNCLQDGDSNLWNTCRVCDSAADQLAWSDNSGAVCDDDDRCTWPDTCAGSSCAGTPKPCDDGLECTSEACDGQGGCDAPILLPGWCLIDGVCFHNRDVNTVNGCLICKAELADAAWSYRDGVRCDDGNDCTVFDSCLSGACGGTPYTCDQQPWCLEETCDGIGGCIITGVHPGDCMIDGFCRASDELNPENMCEACDGSASAYSWSPLTGDHCNDDQSCTWADTCSNGVCEGIAHPCDDGVECTDNVCDGGGGCSFPVSEDWCLIDGTCWTAGATHPTIDCSVCAPPIDQTGWTHQDSNADEVCNGVDDNCDGVTDPENAPGCTHRFIDADHDGVGSGAASRCLCAPDGDWAATAWGDCDDNDPDAFPGNVEACDGTDNDCDGETDTIGSLGCRDYFYDSDGDGYGQSGTQNCLCTPDGYYDALEGGDCNDASIAVHPQTNDFCNGIDDDCDGVTDPDGSTGCVDRFRDEDLDGYGAEPPVCMCSPRGVYTLTSGGDCNDLDGSVKPGGLELCNSVDENCDGITDNVNADVACPLSEGAEANGTRLCEDGNCVLECQVWQDDPPKRAWYDLDQTFSNGCECEADAWEHLGGGDCGHAVSLGSVPDDGTLLTVTGNLPGAGVVDWYSVTFTDPTWNAETGGADAFHAFVELDRASQEEFEFSVTETACSNNPTCASGTLYERAVDFWTATLGENPCSLLGDYCGGENPSDYAECVRVTGDPQRCNSCPAVASPDHHVCTDNTRTVLIRVSRHENLPETCHDYKLTISNGLAN